MGDWEANALNDGQNYYGSASGIFDAGNNPYSAADGEWHNVQMLQRIVDGYASADGKKAILLEVYVDGSYAGYTCKTDYDGIAIGAERVAFVTGYNTQLKFSMDDFVWGTPYEIIETE